jgi:hypothetical protein
MTLASLALVGLAPSWAQDTVPAGQPLVGDWCLVETVLDEETSIPNITWSFDAHGKYRFEIGGSPFSGDYRLEGDTLHAAPYALSNLEFADDSFRANFNGRSRFVKGACPAPKLGFDDHMALIKAVRLGQLDEIRRLIAQAENPDITEPGDTWEHTPLHLAAKFNAKESASLLLSLGAAPNKADAAGNTPLDIAVKKNALAVAGVLLEAGVDPNRADSQGRTPLMFAIGDSDTAMVKLLLEHGAGADAHFSGWDGQSMSLREYAQKSERSSEILELLNQH